MKNYKNHKLNKNNLSEINFMKLNLRKHNFKSSELQKCDFWETNLKNSNFSNTKIQECIFTDSILQNSNFKNSTLINSNFNHSNLKKADFSNSVIKNITLRDAIYDNKTRWPRDFNPKKFGAIKERKKIENKKISVEKKNVLINKIVKSLTQGKGYYVVKNFFDKKKIKKAQKILMKIVLSDKKIAINFNKFSKDKKFLQKWITNLLNINPIFVEFIQPKLVMQVFKEILGEKFICGFFEANCLLPGARGQFPHIDYPYNYNYDIGENIPFKSRNNFLFNCQLLIPLNEMSKYNGSTAFLDHSYRFLRFPNRNAIKKHKFKQVNAPLGSIVLFNGLTWHTSMPNYSSNKERFCVIGQYIPHFIKPMIDIKATTKSNIYKKDKKYLKQLLGINLQFPLKKK
jgi:ectoine hydroxylase-related dioxygenase (phytanoyl-CoA dioxygenase family)|tara:strand:+ start:157 stop:1356 length:1200 start_codon:yes stop_codon:yes gene_type:complete